MTKFEKLVNDALLKLPDARTYYCFLRIDPEIVAYVKSLFIECHEKGESFVYDDDADVFTRCLPSTRPMSSDAEEAAAIAEQIVKQSAKDVIESYYRQISRKDAKTIIDGLRALSEAPGSIWDYVPIEFLPGHNNTIDGFAKEWDAANPDSRPLYNTPDTPIAKMRKAAGITQKQFSELLGVDQRSISRWENGLVAPRAATLIKMADVLGCDVRKLV